PFAVDGRLPDGYSSPEQHVVAVGRDLRVNPCQLVPVVDPAEYDLDARPPVSGPDAGVEPESSSVVPLAAGGAGVVAAGAAVGLMWRRRRPR
ncbi:MAG TPA: hypothetical protein VFZ64_03290, partial [Nocardioidaceae bacterium]